MQETADRVEAQLTAWVRDAFQAAFGEAAAALSARAQPATDPRFGDYQCNDALQAAKSLRRSPRAIAEAVAAALPLPPMLERVEVAGPGFINLTVSPAWLAEEVAALSAAPRFGIPDLGQGRTVVMDYSSPNVAKPMHIGHIRSTVIGNAIDRMHRALGYRVIADNHLGDWGTQFGILIQGYRGELTDEERAHPTIEILERAYVRSYNRSQEDPAWKEACKAELVRLQQGDAENRALWERFISISLEEFNRIYRRLEVAFDLCRGESYYNDRLADTVQMLVDRGLAVESEGALVVRLEDEGMPVCMVRKSDGGYNYATTDIATALSREAEFAPERVIYVTDERQQLHFRQFFSVCARLGCATRLEHVWFGLMRLPEGTFSTRQGNVIRLESLLNEAERRALAIIQASHDDMPEEEQRELARAVGIGAIKYADLSHDPQTLIVFAWEKALALDGNSGPYLQYAHARVCSLLDKFGELAPGADPWAGALLLDTPVEKALALHLTRFPDAVRRAAQSCKPNVLADYLFGLAQIYSSFYQSSPALKAEPEIRASRIRLCAITAQALAEGLNLLGMRAPRRI